MVALSKPSATATLPPSTASTSSRRRTGMSVVQNAPATITTMAAAV
jgi:hypothetical protein